MCQISRWCIPVKNYFWIILLCLQILNVRLTDENVYRVSSMLDIEIFKETYLEEWEF